MKTFTRITLFAALLTYAQAQANYQAHFSGRWVGAGQVTTNSPFVGNKTYPCSSIEIEMLHSATELVVKSYKATCQMAGSDWGPYTFQIEGSKVIEDGQETGSFIGDTFKSLQASGGVQYAFNLRLKETPNGQIPVLESYYGTRNMAGAIVIEGNLKTAP